MISSIPFAKVRNRSLTAAIDFVVEVKIGDYPAKIYKADQVRDIHLAI